jgi:hypothetical protein
MKFVLLICALFCFNSISFAAAKPTADVTKALCDSAGIESLKFGYVLGFAPGSDYCSQPSHFFDFPNIPVHKISTNLILKIKDLHEKVAELFGVENIDQLFLKGRPKIVIMPSSSGPLDSSVSKDSINLGVFSKWNGVLEEAVYVHELGHYIAKALPPTLQYFTYLNDLPIFAEMIPDYVGIHVTGGLVSKIPELPQCLQDTRPDLGVATYNYPSGFFQAADVSRGTKQCCANLDSSVYPLGYNMCHQMSNSPALLNLPDFSMDPLDAKFLLQKTKNPTTPRLMYDSHRLGIPIMGFFAKLEEVLNRPIMKEWLNHIKNLNVKNSKWTCRTAGTPEIPAFTVYQFSWEQILKQFVDQLKTEENGDIISGNWNYFAIDKTKELMLASQEDLAIRDAAIKYVKLINAPDHVSKVCLNDFVKGDWIKNENPCRVICELNK